MAKIVGDKKYKEDIKKHEQCMQCSPSCPYFPEDAGMVEWVQDEKVPYIKRRAKEKDWRCGYDGHIIVDWYAQCPKNNTENKK